MKSQNLYSPFYRALATLALTACAVAPAGAGTLWTGPVTNYTQTSAAATFPTRATNTDQITSRVWLSRTNRAPLFNAKTESANSATSPADTEWAFGTTNNFATLTYHPWSSVIGGPGVGSVAAAIVNKNMVVHLKTDDIYIGIKFTAWAQHGVGGFSYTRNTPALVVAPTVNITNPAAGVVFAAPANVTIGASTSGSVTNVTFSQGSTVLGSATVAPFNLTPTLSAGSYALTAVATAGGVSATSAVVNIRVVNPAPVTLGSPHISNQQFIFSYSADPGLTYVVQSASTFPNWVPLATNVATANLVFFTNAAAGSGANYFEVVRQPNP